MMEQLGAVQQKISCVFETTVLDEQSTKRENQSYRVVATNVIKQRALDNDIHNAVATEKLDGTCVHIREFEGKPWLWARFDRKPNKGAEKRFRKYQHQKQKQGGGDSSSNVAQFKWDVAKDFKETPEYWIPASGVSIVAGSPVPDDIGHTPGWVPISPSARQYCWHLSAVDLNAGLALVLREEEGSTCLCIDCIPLSQLVGCTAELIGTNINGNPYGLGSKKFPIHLLVIHGTIRVRNPPGLTSDGVKAWFQGAGQVEGIVWHCANGTLFKAHRNHVSLPWPVQEPTLTSRKVRISMETAECDLDMDSVLISQLLKFKGHTCESVRDLERIISTVEENVRDSGRKDSNNTDDNLDTS